LLIKDNLIDKTLSSYDICNLLSNKGFIPLYLEWELIDKCNFSCPFCYIVNHSNNSLIRFNDIKTELELLLKNGLLYSKITGGEPLLHPDFTEIYKFLKSNGVFIDVFTNGYLITDKHIELFKEFKPVKIEISIYAIDNEIFQTNTNSGNKSEKVLENILKLRDNDINVVCKTVLNSLTINNYNKIKEWCKLNEIPYYFSTEIDNAIDGKILKNYELQSNIKSIYENEKFNEPINENLYTDDIFKIPEFGKKKCFSCAVSQYGMFIDSSFTLFPCSSLRLNDFAFDIKRNGILNSINELQKVITNFIDKEIIGCFGCNFMEFCKMCPAISDINRNEIGCIVNFSVPDNFCKKHIEKINSYDINR